jgi:hypothetical protein
MYHRTRWTPEKIKQRLELIIPLVYVKRKLLCSFRFHELESVLSCPPVKLEVDECARPEISAYLNLRSFQIITLRVRTK